MRDLILCVVIHLACGLQGAVSIGPCPAAFTGYQGICIRLQLVPATYCDAWKACTGAGGHLATGTEIQKVLASGLLTFTDMYAYYVGVNDLLVERYKNRTGWRYADGSTMPLVGDWLLYEPGTGNYEPDDGSNGQDCVLIRNSKLYDLTCELLEKSICIHGDSTAVVSARTVNLDHSVLFNNDKQAGCYDTLVTRSRIECVVMSIRNRHYRSLYFDERNRMCALVKYVDSTLPVAMNKPACKWGRFA